MTALSKQTVSLAMVELEARGYAELTTSLQGPVGRAASVYDVAVKAGWLLGLDLGSTHIRVAASTLTGMLITEREHLVDNAPTLANADLGAVAGTIIAPLVKQLSPKFGPLRSACVALSRSVPELRDWRRADSAAGSDIPLIVEQLALPSQVPVYAENNVNCAALGESRHGDARGESEVAYLQVGVGLGAGIISGGVLLRGVLGQGGELRKLPADGLTSFDTAATTAEEWVRADSLLRRYNKSRGDEAETEANTTEEVFARARRSLPVARRIVEEEAQGIGYLAAVLDAIVSPALVILGGGIGGNEYLRDRVERNLIDRGLKIRLSPGELGSGATVAGAAALAAERYLHRLLAPHSVPALSSYESRWSIGAPAPAGREVSEPVKSFV